MSAHRLAVDLVNVNNDRRLWTRIQEARIAYIGALQFMDSATWSADHQSGWRRGR
jgi:hypothetical protein